MSNSFSLVSASNRVDLPDPVLPTTPIFSLDLILNDKSFSTRGKSDLYLMLILLATIELS